MIVHSTMNTLAKDARKKHRPFVSFTHFSSDIALASGKADAFLFILAYFPKMELNLPRILWTSRFDYKSAELIPKS